MIGKVDPDVLAEVILSRTGADDPAVLQGPAYGEDTAAIDLGDAILVVNADPLSLAAEDVGRLGVHVVCNDVAASGARPRWITNTLFLPEDDPVMLEQIVDQVDTVANRLDVAIVGGHAEYAPDLPRPLLALSALGVTDRYVPSGGADTGDAVLLTGGAGIEGTAILATDFRDVLLDREVDSAVVDRAATFADEISVVAAAMAVRDRASGMHDPTEGGVLAGIYEMAVASDATFEIERAAIPVRPETRAVCETMDVDPLRIFGSGALVITTAAEAVDRVVASLASADVESAVIGRVTDGPPGLRLDGDPIEEPPRDHLYPLWERSEDD